MTKELLRVLKLLLEDFQEIVVTTYVNGQIVSDTPKLGGVWIENDSFYNYVRQEDSLEFSIEEIVEPVLTIRIEWKTL